MAFCTVSIAGAQNDSRFGKSQVPIKSYIEKRGEGFEQESLLKHLFRMDTSRNFGEKYTGDTAMDDFEPVGEGGTYPENDFGEGFAQTLEHMTWKNRFVVTREMADDNKIGSMKKKASQLVTSYNRTRENFGRALYLGGLSGTTVAYKGKKFKTSSADQKPLFSKVHPNLVDSKKQSNLYADAFSVTALDKAEAAMQNTKGDTGELLSVAPDTIWIPNDPVLKRTVFATIGADKDPTTANNAFNFQFGKWSVMVDPYLTYMMSVMGVTGSPWFLLDSKFFEDQDGPVFLDRTKLDVKSVVDDNNDNNLWNGFSRWTGGFVDWRFALAGGVTGGSNL